MCYHYTTLYYYIISRTWTTWQAGMRGRGQGSHKDQMDGADQQRWIEDHWLRRGATRSCDWSMVEVDQGTCEIRRVLRRPCDRGSSIRVPGDRDKCSWIGQTQRHVCRIYRETDERETEIESGRVNWTQDQSSCRRTYQR